MRDLPAGFRPDPDLDPAETRFVDTARAGDLVDGDAAVVRRAGSLVFVQGRLTCGGRPLLTFDGLVPAAPDIAA